MDFEKGRIIEEIFSIEDFDKVDEKLMEKICGNSEYRKLFEEAKQLSSLVKSSVPAAEKGGTSLHDAVLNRVKVGDTAPRYINVKKRYPFATAACLLVVCAVVLFARSGIAGKFASKNFNSAENNVAIESEDFDYFAFDVYTDDNSDSFIPETDSDGGVMMFSKYTQNDADSSCEEQISEEAKAENGKNKAVADESAVEDSLSDTTVEYKLFAHFDAVNTVWDYADEETAEIARAESAATEPYEGESSKETSESVLKDEVILAMERAVQLGAMENAISAAQILELGEELYLNWFETICERADFASAYRYDNFKAYCDEAKKS